MINLGATRSDRKLTHLLQTPDTFVVGPLPGMAKGQAIIHTGPSAGARFTQYTALLEPGGCLGATIWQRFLYVLEGTVNVLGHQLSEGHYGFVPQGESHSVVAPSGARLAVIEKPYLAVDGVPLPEPFFGDESKVPSNPLDGDPQLQVKVLLPGEMAHDFAVNTMEYLPGASLARVEVHVMEHGLLMLRGGGIYRLGDSWYPVSAGDFIWMAPFCAQWFGALGTEPAKYLIYKDWNRPEFL